MPIRSLSSKNGVRGMLTVDDATALHANGQLETVVVGFTDIYGRMMGKRYDAECFLKEVVKGGTHGCDYLLACDMEMNPIPGFEYANWERGYGDFHMVPDMSTLRHVSWMPRTAMVLCDIKDNRTHELVPFAPRSVLRKQIDEASKLGYSVLAASELEYYMYRMSYRDVAKEEYRQSAMKNVSEYLEDYHLLSTAKQEDFHGVCRRYLSQSGIPVENSKGEAGIGQHELNVSYTEILAMGDRHAVYKQLLKEVADQLDVSVTFMAKPFTDATGSGCHIHLSLHDAKDGKNVFPGNETLGPIKCSEVFKQFLAGWLKYTPDMMPFYAPTIDSYKRFQSASWAPTRLAWSYDNRTAGFRVVGSGKSLRIECRIPGADVNPYLAFAASLASGLAGIRQKLAPPPLFEGDIYQARHLPTVPKSLREAVSIFKNSTFANEALGEKVVQHYAHFYEAEQAAYDKTVTDWERKRYFERI